MQQAINRLLPENWKVPLLISAVYAVVGVVWIFFSDRWVSLFIHDVQAKYWLNLTKGMFYVILTGILLFLLIYKQLKKRTNYINLLNTQNQLMDFIIKNHSGIAVLMVEKGGQLILASGKDDILPIKADEMQGKNISHWFHQKPWFNLLNEVVRMTFETGSGTAQIEDGNKIYQIQGNLFIQQPNNNLACIQLDNITDKYDLIDLNGFQKNQINELTTDIELLNEQNNFNVEMHSSVLNGLTTAIFVHELTPEGRLGEMVDLNLSASLLFNCRKSELKRLDILSFLSFDTTELKQLFADNNFTLKPSINAKAILTPVKSGHTNNVEIRSNFIAVAKKHFILTTVRDLSEQLSEIEHLKTAYGETTPVLDFFDEGIALVNRSLTCVYYNNAMTKIFNAPPHPFATTPLPQLLQSYGLIDTAPFFEQTLTGQKVIVPEFFMPNTEQWVSVHLFPITIGTGETTSAMCVFYNTTEKKRLDNELVKLKENVDFSTKLRNSFLANVSHEIRTPMNGIVGFIELMDFEKLSPVQLNYLNLIKQSSDHLLSLLDSIIEISMLENNQVPLNNQWFSPSELLTEIEQYTSELLENQLKHDVSLTKIDEGGPNELLYSDKEKMANALKQICNNAVKFTDRGFIILSLKKLDNDRIEFVVSDSGIGFDPKNTEAALLPFITFKNNRDQVYDGIGLGLSICKSLVVMLGGSIEIETQINNGSSVFVTIPIKSAQKTFAVEHTNAIPWTSSKKILFVQYGFNSADMIRQTLKPYNIEVIQAYDGISAIELFYEHQNIDMVICDIRLSDIDAFEVLHAIKRINKATPIIAQTAYYMNDERKKCLEAGFTDYLVKPINKSTFLNALMNSPINNEAL